MSYLMKTLLGGYMDQADDGQGGGGGGGGETPEQKAAREAAEAEAARKAAEDAKTKAQHKPTDEEAKLLKEVMDKKEKLAAATKAREELETRLREFEGIDPVEIKRLMKEKKDAEELEAVRKGEWEKIKAQMNEAHEAALKAKDGVIVEKENTINNLQATISDLTVGNAFATSQFVKEELVLSPNKARALMGSHFEFKDGNIVAYDKPAGAKGRAPLVDAKGNPLPFDEAIRKIVDADPDKDTILKSKIAPGAGSSTNPKLKPKQEAPAMTGRSKIEAALASAK